MSENFLFSFIISSKFRCIILYACDFHFEHSRGRFSEHLSATHRVRSIRQKCRRYHTSLSLIFLLLLLSARAFMYGHRNVQRRARGICVEQDRAIRKAVPQYVHYNDRICRDNIGRRESAAAGWRRSAVAVFSYRATRNKIKKKKKTLNITIMLLLYTLTHNSNASNGRSWFRLSISDIYRRAGAIYFHRSFGSRAQRNA